VPLPERMTSLSPMSRRVARTDPPLHVRGGAQRPRAPLLSPGCERLTDRALDDRSGLRFEHDGFVYGVRFSPDGRTLFAAIALPSAPGTIIQRYDTRSGEPVGGSRKVSNDLVTMMLTRDGGHVVVNSGEEAVIYDARTLRPLRRWPIRADEASPESRRSDDDQAQPGRQPQRESARRPVATISSTSDVTDEPNNNSKPLRR
jgi:hypothetical protein